MRAFDLMILGGDGNLSISILILSLNFLSANVRLLHLIQIRLNFPVFEIFCCVCPLFLR